MLCEMRSDDRLLRALKGRRPQEHWMERFLRWGLLTSAVVLTAFGLVMVSSASYPEALENNLSPHHYMKRQAMWALLGFVVLLIGWRFPHEKLRRWSWVALLLAVAMLCAALLSPLGEAANGVRRWINVAGFRFQPSEFAKIALLLYLSSYLSRWPAALHSRRRRASRYQEGADVDRGSRSPLKDFLYDFAPMLHSGLVISVVAGLVLLGPHLSGALLLLLLGGYMVIAAGTRWSHLFLMLGLLIVVIAPLAATQLKGYQIFRLTEHFKEKGDPSKQGSYQYQVDHARKALGSGGWTGSGLGKSMAKQLYLPAAHNDFILAIIGEEMGFVGTITVLGLFGLIAFCGFTIARLCDDQFGTLLASGLTVMLVLQAQAHVAVVLGVVPTTGIPLPFISAGGSLLTCSLLAVGLLLNIARHRDEELDDANREGGA